MPKYILHVGPSKTGTTYLQSSLGCTRRALLKQGIAYPLELWPRRTTVNHEYVCDEIRAPEGTRLHDAMEKLNRSDLKLVVLSSEAFPTLSTEELTGFRDMLGGSEVEVVYYLRRWSDRIPSGWQQGVKGGSTLDMPESLMRAMLNVNLGTLNYAAQVDKFAEVFGKDSVKLISYNNVVDRKQDLFRHFCATVLRVDYVGRLPPSRKNESINIYDTELLRVLNIFEELETNRNPKSRRDRFAQFLALREEMDLSWLKDRMKEHVGELKLNDRAPVFELVYKDLRERYLDKVVDPVGEAGLFFRKTRTVQYVRPDYMLAKGTTDVIRDIHERLRAPA
jgi:hypothetical protein